MKILRLNSQTFPIIPEEREILSCLNTEIIELEGINDDEIATAAKDCDAIMVVSSFLRNAVVKQLAKCRIIARMGTGYDKIDVAQATRQGIMVTNLPAFCTDEVADHTMSLLLSVARQLDYFQKRMRIGKGPCLVPHIHRLSTRILGIVGFGRIGRAVAKRANAFGMKILVVDPALKPDEAQAPGIQSANMDRALSESDYLCLLCPLSNETRQMLTMNELRKMKPSAVLINTSRGELVNENDLAQALREKTIRFAAIDVYGTINVFAPDGFPTIHPYFQLDNVVLTPHVAALSEEAMLEQRIKSSEEVVRVLSGKWPENLVNRQVKPWFKIKHPG